MPTRELVSVRDVRKSFAGVHALRGVSLTINRGEIRCLVGENGCGKSTLIKVIAGVIPPDSGEIVLNGRRYERLYPLLAIQGGIQVIYQDLALFPNLTVAENLSLAYMLSRRRRIVSSKEVRRVALEAASRVKAKLDLDARVEELSVADKQLVAIARALLHEAKLIIMDEPTTALTQNEVEQLFQVVDELRRDGVSILFVSHKLNEVLAIADQITVMRNGVVTAEGRRDQFDASTLVYHMTGRKIRETRYEYAQPAGDAPVLRVDALGRRGSFQRISFEVRSGEIVGITGLLGSGKTELAEALFGLRPADTGRIFVQGQPARIKSPTDAMRWGIGYVPEDRLTQGLFLTQAIGTNIVASSVDDLVGRLRMINFRRVRQEVERWISDLKIATPSSLLPVQNLSGGNQQRVVLARWLARSPRILVLNAPTVGVDVGSKSEIHCMIRELARNGMAIIIISDDVPELLQTCNRILLMRRGSMVKEFETATLDDNVLTRELVGA